MSKKDFIALADAIREHNVTHRPEAPYSEDAQFTDGQIKTLADFCREQNPRFMRERWLGYIAGECGPNGGSIRKSAA